MGAAFGNMLATFVRKPAFQLLVSVDKSFKKICDNLTNAQDFLAPFLLLRSHAAFRGACRMATSGQASEAFPLLRSCIEYALYALHINSDPKLGEVWMRRHDDDDALKKCKRSFRHVDVIATLEDRDANLCRTVEQLYERTIDFGAHPNERAITGSMRLGEGKDTFQLVYLHGDSLVLDHSLKATAQVGLGSLLVFEHIFRDRYRILTLDLELQRLRNML
jgi:hypothetical protein